MLDNDNILSEFRNFRKGFNNNPSLPVIFDFSDLRKNYYNLNFKFLVKGYYWINSLEAYNIIILNIFCDISFINVEKGKIFLKENQTKINNDDLLFFTYKIESNDFLYGIYEKSEILINSDSFFNKIYVFSKSDTKLMFTFNYNFKVGNLDYFLVCKEGIQHFNDGVISQFNAVPDYLETISKFGSIYIFQYSKAHRKKNKSSNKNEYFNCYHLYNKNGNLIHPINFQLITSIIIKKHIIICCTEDFKYGVISSEGKIVLPHFYEGFKITALQEYFFTEISKVDTSGNYFVEHNPHFSLTEKHINKLKRKNITIIDSLKDTIINKNITGRPDSSNYLFYSDMPKYLWMNLEDQNLQEFIALKKNKNLNIHRTTYSSNQIKNGTWQKQLLNISRDNVISLKKFLKDRTMGCILEIDINLDLFLELLKYKILNNHYTLLDLNVELLKIIVKTPIENESNETRDWIAEIKEDKIIYKKKNLFRF